MTAPTILETAILPDYISYESTFYYNFHNEVVESLSGAEQRIAYWTDYRLEGDLASAVTSETNLNNIIALYMICKGTIYAFRVKFWKDYVGTTQTIGTGDDLETEFQLVKVYSYGGYTYTRNIYKPVTGTVHIFFDAVEQMAGWSVSTSTGLVTFDVAPGVGVVITATYEFHYPMRFATDKLSTVWKTYEVGQAAIPVIEVR